MSGRAGSRRLPAQVLAPPLQPPPLESLSLRHQSTARSVIDTTTTPPHPQALADDIRAEREAKEAARQKLALTGFAPYDAAVAGTRCGCHATPRAALPPLHVPPKLRLTSNLPSPRRAVCDDFVRGKYQNHFSIFIMLAIAVAAGCIGAQVRRERSVAATTTTTTFGLPTPAERSVPWRCDTAATSPTSQPYSHFR